MEIPQAEFQPFFLPFCPVQRYYPYHFNWLILPYVSYHIVGFIFLLGILCLSLLFRKGPIFFASILYALYGRIFLSLSKGELNVASNEDIILLIFYLLPRYFPEF